MADIIRVLIIDDNNLSLQGLCSILKQAENFQSVTLPMGMELNAMDIKNLEFDVAIVHLTNPRSQLMYLLKAYIYTIKKQKDMPVLVIAEHLTNDELIKIIQYGVAGYLSSNSTPEELCNVIRRLHLKEFYMPANLAYKIVNTIRKYHDMNGSQVLTRQQQKVLNLMILGKHNREIGDALAISERTVEAHARQIYKKLKVTNRTEAFISAVHMGLVDIDQ